MPVGRDVERGKYFLFAVPPLIVPAPGGDIFWQISTIGGGAFGGYMPTCREGERAELLFFACAFPFSRSGGYTAFRI